MKSTAVLETISPEALTRYVRFLVGSFRVGEADDGEVMMRGLTALLGSYPEWAVRAVCDPRSGLPAKSKFFPTLYEVRTACEAQMRPVLEAERRRRIEEANEADKPAPIDELAAERRRAVVAKWREQMALHEAAKAGVETPLAELEVRHLKGEHREMVKNAIDAKITRLTEEFKSTPVKLSDMTLRTPAGRAPVVESKEAVG